MLQGLGEQARMLTWIAPCTTSLALLAKDPSWNSWDQVRHDPGCLLLLAKHSTFTQDNEDFPSLPRILDPETLLEDVFIHLRKRQISTFANWDKPTLRTIYQRCHQLAQLVHTLANTTRRCCPYQGWIAGFLAPLGWLAAGTMDADHTVQCLQECEQNANPLEIQKRYFGMSVTALASRLAVSWNLPQWLRTIISYHNLPAKIAGEMGATGGLLDLVQLAIGESRQHKSTLFFPTDTAAPGLLSIDPEAVSQAAQSIYSAKPPAPKKEWVSPYDQPLLMDLLDLGIENCRWQATHPVEQLHQDIDVLRDSLVEQQTQIDETVRDQKLVALAEFAAGAAHEINNPLAVISGQAQYLMPRETQPERRHALQKIIDQTRRVHGILTNVMQFARPATPQKHPVEMRSLAEEVTKILLPMAKERKIDLQLCESPSSLYAYADAQQIAKAMDCLLRNALEAAPQEGWAKLRLEMPQDDLLRIIVEDNGKGVPTHEESLIFNPFYSGRPAGRGQGFGLPIAWRLAQLHDGNVRMEKVKDMTRFVMTLPLHSGEPIANNRGKLSAQTKAAC